MTEYTPTTDEIRYAATEWLWEPEDFDAWLAAHDAEKRAEWEAERGAEEPEGEHVFIERYGMYHAKFGGIGGDVSSLTLTRKAWKALGEADVLAVSVVPVEQGDET